jgi:hypothetical protein
MPIKDPISQEQFEDPFAQEGYDDFFLGYEKEDCPYDDGTDGEGGWKKGYRKAELVERQLLEDEKKERNRHEN